MNKKGLICLILGLVLFLAGVIVLQYSGIGVVLQVLGIGAMIFGSVFMMAASGRIKADYFESGRTFASDQPSEKVDCRGRSRRTGLSI